MNVHDRSGSAREELVVARLRELAPSLDGEPDPAFRAATRARLVAMAAVRTPAPAPASPLQRLLPARGTGAAPARWRSRLTAGLAGAAMTVTALASLVAVADGAGPGDVLYDLKRGTEQTQLALAGDARGRTLLDFASTRLDELEALVGGGATALPAAPVPSSGIGVSAADADPALVLETLHTMDTQTRDGAAWLAGRAVETTDDEPLDLLAGWTQGQAADLAALQDLVPDAAAEAFGRSLTLLADIGARTDGLQAALDCPAGPVVDGADELGPVPRPCAAPPPATQGPAGSTGGGPTSSGGGSAPEGSSPAQPTAPPATGAAPGAVPGSRDPGSSSGPSGSGGGFGGLPTPSLPVPDLPVPSLPTQSGGGGIPSLPLPPLGTSGGSTDTPPPVVQVPSICLPPLATIGNC